jgi:hypothetical protein
MFQQKQPRPAASGECLKLLDLNGIMRHRGGSVQIAPEILNFILVVIILAEVVSGALK